MKKASQAITNRLLINERLRHQWSQKELAELVGTTTINVSRWERGITAPNAHFRYQLRIIFDKSEEELGFVPLHANRNEELLSEVASDQEASPAAPSSQGWYVPLPYNPLFTGRESILTALYHALHPTQLPAALNHLCILSGLGGCGKTQIALAYAYRYRQNYKAVIWIDASTLETLETSIASLFNLLPFIEKDAQLQRSPYETVINWIQTNIHCLILLDNAQDIEIIEKILSTNNENDILLTTCTQITSMIIPHIDIGPMEVEEGTLFLLRRARYIDLETSFDKVPESFCTHAAGIVQATRGHPLMLDQAGAYIEETRCDLTSYLSLYQTQETALLHRRGRVVSGHPESIACTLLRAIEKVEKANPDAAEILRNCAFLDEVDAIPENSITEQYARYINDPLIFDTAIMDLRKYSLIQRDRHTKILTLHHLTHVILKEKYAPYDQHDFSIAQQPLDIEDAQRAADLKYATKANSKQQNNARKMSATHNLALAAANYGQIHLFKKSAPVWVIALLALISISVIVSNILYPLLNPNQALRPSDNTSNQTEEAQYLQKYDIGLSGGTAIFDTYAGRLDINLKNQAAACLQKGDTSYAINFMTQAISTDVTDGEIQIYNENLHVQQSGAPYVTIVLGLAIAKDATLLIRARAIMQSAFLAQHEINTKGLLPNGFLLRILIDNSGADNAHVATVAGFVSNRIRNGNLDHIIAVVGWPSSSQTLNAVNIITGAHVPMISQSASSTLLSGISPYFFRVNPTDNQQGKKLGEVAVNQFHAQKLLLVQDPTDPYSVSLANAFSENVTALNATVIHSPTDDIHSGVTTVDTYQQSVIKEALEKKVSLIFLSGFDVDAVRLAHALGNASRADPQNKFLANLKILSGDAVATSLLQGIGGGPDAMIATNFPQDIQRLNFSSFAHPDEWAFGTSSMTQRPDFFSDWLQTYKNISIDNASISEPGSHAILTYDAIQVIVHTLMLTQKTITGDAVRQALVSLGKGGVPAFQGIGGLIAFDSQGDAINKAFVLLDIENIDGSNHIVLKQVIGNFH